MALTRPAKKNETIEIRLPDETKAAFMERCRQQERTASDAIRSFIEQQVAPQAPPRQPRMTYWRVAVAGVIGAMLGAGVTAPSFARSAPTASPGFEQLDRNHDGVLSYREFQRR